MPSSPPWYDPQPADKVLFAALEATGAAKLVGTVTTPPTAAAGSNAGTSPPAPVVAATSSDLRGTLTFGTGTTPAAGNQVVVTFNSAYGAAPVVDLIAGNALTAALNLFVTAVGTGGFTVGTQGAPAASQANTVYSVGFQVIG